MSKQRIERYISETLSLEDRDFPEMYPYREEWILHYISPWPGIDTRKSVSVSLYSDSVLPLTMLPVTPSWFSRYMIYQER